MAGRLMPCLARQPTPSRDMPTHSERRRLPYAHNQLFSIVADVERYPEFLPWCQGARVYNRDGNKFQADLLIGFKMIKECFTSRVELHYPRSVEVSSLKGPFTYLTNCWMFEAATDGAGVWVDFHLAFELRSPLLRRIMAPLFKEAVSRMVRAFERRAQALYRNAPELLADSRADLP